MNAHHEVYLVAQGEDPSDRWRKVLPAATSVCLGRAAGFWSVPWEPRISRQHAELLWNGTTLSVRRLPAARNPIYFQGKECEEFDLPPGGCFVIGRTTFTLLRQRVSLAEDHPTPAQERSFATHYLKQVAFRNPNYRLEVLSRLPRAISTAGSDVEIVARLVNLVLSGMPNAEAVAVVSLESSSTSRQVWDSWQTPAPQQPADSEQATSSQQATEVHDRRGQVLPPVGQSAPGGETTSAPSIRIIHWDRRQLIEGEFRPSRRLILEAHHRRQSVLHIWRAAPQGTILPTSLPSSQSPAAGASTGSASPYPFAIYTAGQNIDWAIGTPIRAEGVAWVLYAAGRFQSEWGSGTATPENLQEDVKFLDLVAEMAASLWQLRTLERRQAIISQFLPRPVIERLDPLDLETALQPREVEATILFCDLRGFSQESERQADQLLPLLDRISAALQVMTHHILEEGGVIGDFQGDAAMGFWGWPLPQEDRVLKASRAALAIRRAFAQAAELPENPLAGFQIGIGIASGRAVAGRIGTSDHAKITIFGPPVNLAARLEGATKILHVPILLDEETATLARQTLPLETGRIRPLAQIRPYGLDLAVLVHELLPPYDEYALLSSEDLETCAAAVRSFLEGRWEEAFTLLHRLPAADRGADFLTAYIAQHHRKAPPGWDGTINLASK